MAEITKPIMLDETGQAIVNALMQNDIVTQKEAEISNYADAKLQTILDEIPPSYSEILHIVESISAFVTPEQFGAKGDGITDDTEAIQNALDSDYPVVFYSNHNYKISDTLIINHPKVVYGNNARILAGVSDSEYSDGMFDIDSTENVTIFNLYVDGNTNASCGVLISQSTNISIFGCKIINIENATDVDCQGIRLHRSKKCTIYNAYIVGVEYTGTARKSARGILYNLCEECIVENSCISNVFAPKAQPAGDGDGDGDGIHFHYDKVGETETYGNMIMKNVTIENCTKRCVKIQQYGVVIDSCKFPYNANAATLYDCIIAIYDNYTTIKNCYIAAKSNAYVTIGFATSTGESYLSHTLIDSNTFAMHGTYYQGAISVSDYDGRPVKDLIITNNKFISDSNTEDAVQLRRTCEDVVISGNYCENTYTFLTTRFSGSYQIKRLTVSNNTARTELTFVFFKDVSIFSNIVITGNNAYLRAPSNYCQNGIRFDSNDAQSRNIFFTKMTLGNNSCSHYFGIPNRVYLHQLPNEDVSTGFAQYPVTPPNGYQIFVIENNKPYWWYIDNWYDATGTAIEEAEEPSET